MAFGDEAIRALRQSLRISPDNVPLRLHLAASLMGMGRFDEAEQEFRQALTQQRDHVDGLAGLAECYFRQGKASQALVIVEDLAKRPAVSAKVLVLYARLLLLRGDIPDAVAQYKLALELDPEAADGDLSQRLGVGEQNLDGEVVEGRVRESWQPAPSGGYTDIERPSIRFRDVGGMDELKDEIGMKIVLPLKHPELYKAYGKAAGGGILMYGPPGCGKTYLARATAGEIDACFLAVGINDVLDMWLGNSERNLHALFQQARDNRPSVLFFDEVDALGGRRSDMQGGSGRQLINQFLAEMDGVGSANEGVLILAATNAPWHVDPAFRRPGRFDRVLFVPPPDATARAAILRLHCRDKPIASIDFEHLAKKTENFSGADLKAIVDIAVEAKLRDAMRKGEVQPLAAPDLMSAAKMLKPTTREWFSTARNYAVYSNQGGMYDDVLKYLKLQ
jgi:AAA+ superfamily predicted ATPase